LESNLEEIQTGTHNINFKFGREPGRLEKKKET
jgi:hypothetical protein